MTGSAPTAAMAHFLPALMVLALLDTGSLGTGSLDRSSAASPSPTTSTSAARSAAPAVCRTPARRGFVPRRAKIVDVGRRIPVLARGRDARKIPLPPPLTSLGKRSFAWDKYGPKPGSRRGNVRLNAHTYPDGSALGNKLLRNLVVGDRIIIRGDTAALCYKVTRRVTVTPRNFLASYYRTTGKPKLAIVVCSGRRLGPGRWTHRTIWFAKPSTA